MLRLDDDRWALLTTFFGEQTDVPKVLTEWLASIGFDQEHSIYFCDLLHLFLHQATITNAAFAVVPWLVNVCTTQQSQFTVEYLTHVALVEANRLRSGVCWNREGTERYPEWIMVDYRQAIIESRNLVDDVIEAEWDEERKRGLVAMKPALYGNADLAWSQW